MIECAPAVSVDVVNIAVPLLRVLVPKVVLPSLNVTVPVAADGETVAVNFTDEPYVEGFSEDASVVVVLVFAEASPLRVAQRRMRPVHRGLIRITLCTSLTLEFEQLDYRSAAEPSSRVTLAAGFRE